MPSILFLVFTYLTEAAIVYFYVKNIYPTKKNHFLSILLCTVLYIASMLVFRYITNNEVINSLLLLIVNIIIIKIGFDSSIKSAVFHGIILCTLLYISEFVTMYIIALTEKISSKTSINEHFEIGAILSHLLYFTLCMFLSRFSSKENRSKSWGKWFSLSLFPISSMFIILVIRNLTNNNTSPSQNLICVLSIAFLLIVNFIVYLIYEQAEKNNQKLLELEIVNQRNEIDLQYLKLLEKKNEQMQIMAHDYKRNLSNISSLSDSLEVKEFINNMLGELTQYNQIAKTKNSMFDVILDKYTNICAAKGIEFLTDIVTDNLNFLAINDISSLLNNIFDNAVEAAEQSEKRLINLQISNILTSYHKIIVTNSCDTEPDYNSNGELITKKKDKGAHGFGTKSINKIVNKYHGEMQWDYDKTDKIFKLIILIPDEQII